MKNRSRRPTIHTGNFRIGSKDSVGRWRFFHTLPRTSTHAHHHPSTIYMPSGRAPSSPSLLCRASLVLLAALYICDVPYLLPLVRSLLFFHLNYFFSAMVPKPKSGTRAALPSTTNGIGRHFSSPHKVKNPRKTQTFVSFPGQNSKCQRLLAHLDDLLSHKGAPQPSACETAPDAAPESSITEVEMMGIVEEPSAHEHADRPLTQSARLDHFFSNWKSIIPTIVRPYLEYLNETLGKPLTQHVSSLSACLQDCEKQSTHITGLYFDCQSLLCPAHGDIILNALSVFVYHCLALSMCHPSTATCPQWPIPYRSIPTSHGCICRTSSLLSRSL